MSPLKSLSCESLLGFVSLCLDFMNNDNSPDAIDIRICMTKAMAYELFLKENILTGKIEEYNHLYKDCLFFTLSSQKVRILSSKEY